MGVGQEDDSPKWAESRRTTRAMRSGQEDDLPKGGQDDLDSRWVKKP